MSMPITDRFRNFYDATGPLDGPLTRAAAITAGGSDLAFIPRAVIVGVAGDLTVDFVEGATGVVIKNVPAGIPLWIRVQKITAATATNIVILD